MWNLDRHTVSDLFRNESGTLVFGESGRPRKRDYLMLRIPESVVARVYQRRTVTGRNGKRG